MKTNPKTPTLDPALETAFAALKTYDRGSSRGALLPIDDAVVACARDSARGSAIELRLIQSLPECSSDPAREFILSKLALVGSERCLPAVMTCGLTGNSTATAVRNALESIEGAKATKALLSLLPKAGGIEKIGIVNSLALRKDRAATGVLKTLLKESDPGVVSAALTALGRSGTPRAAKALLGFSQIASDAIAAAFADAALTCAVCCANEGRRTEARALFQTVVNSSARPYVRQVAAQRLAAC